VLHTEVVVLHTDAGVLQIRVVVSHTEVCVLHIDAATL